MQLLKTIFMGAWLAPSFFLLLFSIAHANSDSDLSERERYLRQFMSKDKVKEMDKKRELRKNFNIPEGDYSEEQIQYFKAGFVLNKDGKMVVPGNLDPDEVYARLQQLQGKGNLAQAPRVAKAAPTPEDVMHEAMINAMIQENGFESKSAAPKEANMLSGAMDMVKMQFGEGQKSKNQSIVDTEYSMLVASLIRPFSAMSESEAIMRIRSKMKPGMQKFLEKLPKLEAFIARLIQHPRALPDIVTMIGDRSRLMIFAAVNIFIFIAFRFFKASKDSGFLRRMRFGVFKTCLVLSLRAGVFVYFFHNEFSNFGKVFSKTFL